MANRLEVAAVNAIYKRLEHGWSQQRIAWELGIDRETVARYQREAAAAAPPGPKPAEAPPGSSGPVAAACEGDGDSNPPGRPSAQIALNARVENIDPSVLTRRIFGCHADASPFERIRVSRDLIPSPGVATRVAVTSFEACVQMLRGDDAARTIAMIAVLRGCVRRGILADNS